jgi:hypothetical protein
MDFRSPNMKKRIRRCDPRKQSHWEQVVRRWEQSSQSVRAYCRAEGLRETAFYWWRRELARRGLLSDAAAKARADTTRVPSTARSASTSCLAPAARVRSTSRAMPVCRAAATSGATLAPRVSPRAARPGRRAAAFLPLQVVEDDAASAGGGVEIVLAQGRTLRVRAGFDRQTLAAVLAVLEARPC